MNKLLAFHNDPKIKAKYIKRVKAHYKADEIMQGVYWENGKGCAVGCTVEQSRNSHEAMEKELGIPLMLSLMEDIVFEELKNGEAKEFPLKFLQAIPVGADLSKVIPQLVIWQFEDPKYGLKNISAVSEDKELMGWCEEVVALYKRELKGKEPTAEEYYQLYLKIESGWAWARSGAWAWAWARSGAWAWARAGAGAGAGAGAWAWARARAWAWARSGARSGAEYDSRILIIEGKLLELLRDV